MKKASIGLIALLLALSGCGNKPAEEGAPSPNALTQTEDGATLPAASVMPEQTSGDSFVFEANGIAIPMHAEATPILKQLGTPQSYFESQACAFPGLNKIYQYSSFDVYAYEKDGIDYIASVILFDDTVATKEGVTLFNKKSDVIKAYGDKFTNNLNLYVYDQGKSQLRFVIENDQVTSIEYLAKI
ncbi:hypothetical protein [Paenibacillus glycanilyticus]|uniref:Lipoprotein n=1 Tax=Paenibacillus glycanilyticus TaxID=126569 RepID=A0ABQ6GII3_9BACL|nr:hypothetical protein [Paenibacillus glycanilyticus]GLX70694.1 hypothetical protein MU1_50400 [Paenibacillus glycanilyticus]